MTTPQRDLTQAMHTATPIDVPKPHPDLPDWLTAQARERSLRWLLAHTDAGVIWGEYREDGQLHLSHVALPQPVPLSLDWLTLQQARLFSEAGELRLWHDGQQWHATLLTDQQANNATGYYFDEPHLLWGWALEKDGEQADGFFLLKEGTRNIVHMPPAAATEKQRARLVVRHYLTEDVETGLLYTAASRLVKLEEGKKEQCNEQE